MATRKEIHDRVLNATCKEELAVVYGEWPSGMTRTLSMRWVMLLRQ